MHRFTVAAFAVLAVAAAAAPFAAAQTQTMGGDAALTPKADERRPVVVTEPTRLFVLAEMRGMLAAAQGVAEATGKGDWPGAAAAAQTSGLKAFQGMPKAVMMELPGDFRAIGMQSHMAFDAVAEAAMTARDPAAVSAKLGAATQFCVACHESFRFVSRP